VEAEVAVFKDRARAMTGGAMRRNTAPSVKTGVFVEVEK